MLTEDIMYGFSDFAAIRRIINPTTLLKRECRTRKELEKESAGRILQFNLCSEFSPLINLDPTVTMRCAL